MKPWLNIITSTVIAGCAATGLPPGLSVDKSVRTFDGLFPAASEFFDRVYVADPLDLSDYTHLLPQAAANQFRHPAAVADSTIKQIPISTEERARFEAELASAIGDNLAQIDRLKITDTPAEDALALWGTLVDINAYIEEDGTEIAEFNLVLELRDSMTDTTLVRVIHPYRIPLVHDDPDRSWVELERVLDSIALTIRDRLNGLLARYGRS